MNSLEFRKNFIYNTYILIWEGGIAVRKVFSAIADYIRETDKILLGLCLAASLFGSFMILSATRYTGSASKFYVQLVAVFLGLAAAVVISLIDYKNIVRFWPLIAAGAVGLVLLTLKFGYTPEGSDDSAWLLLPGGLSLQPSELLKIAFSITFAKHVSMIRESDLNKFRNVVLLALHGLSPFALIVIQGDDGSALILLVIFLVMFFAAGVKWRYFAIGAAALAVVVPIAWFRFLSSWQKNRILILFDHEMDPLGIGWQQGQSVSAIASGGVLGKGYMQGSYAQSGAVPKGYNDFIFATVGEELGFFGSLALVAILFLICFRILMVAKRSRDRMGVIICVGIFGMFMAQTLVNLGMCLYLFPVVGVTLPFFSAGGTSLVCLYLGVGMVLSVYKHRNKRVLLIGE